MWMIDDFTLTNGSTRVIEGSHLRDGEPPSGTATHPDEVIVLSGRPATVQYRQALPQRGPRNLDQLYTPEATEMLNTLREQIRIARESEDAGA